MPPFQSSASSYENTAYQRLNIIITKHKTSPHYMGWFYNIYLFVISLFILIRKGCTLVYHNLFFVACEGAVHKGLVRLLGKE